MVEVRLHGALAQRFGRVWHLDIASPAEAVPAIEAGRPGFRQAILDLEAKGMVFRVRTKDHDYDNDDVSMHLGRSKRVDIIPIVRGASAGVRFVIGAVLVVAGIYFQNPYLIQAGVALMVGSVVEWLMPVTKREDESKSTQSWTLNGPTNTVDQGMPVPIIYGEVLTGSHPISAGVSAAQVTPTGALTPEVVIGGDLTPGTYTRYAATYTVVVHLSASPFNLSDPYTYAWTYTGFAAASARRLVSTNQATLHLELDYPVNAASVTDTGTVTVTMTGRDPEGQNVTLTKTETVTPFVSWHMPAGG